MRKKKECPAVEQSIAVEKPKVKNCRKSRKTMESCDVSLPAENAVMPQEEKVDGRTKKGRLQKVNVEIDELTKKRDALLEECSTASIKLDRLLGNIKFLPVLLSAFNALIDNGEVKLEKPEKGSDYWYIRAMPITKSFVVVACQWHDWTSDHYRYCKGNMFLDENICNSACQAMNEMLCEL